MAMSGELVIPPSAQVAAAAGRRAVPSLVERAGGAARYAWEEFFFGEHHNPHTHKAYQRAVRRFLAWCEQEGVELGGVTPGMIVDHLAGLGGSPAQWNQHLAALRGFFDRLVQRHVIMLNPAASVRGVKEQVIEGKTPQITIEQAKALLASIRVSRKVRTDRGEEAEAPLVIGLRDKAILATMAYTIVRAGAVARLRLGDFQHDGTQYVLRFREKGGKSREIPVRHDLEGYIRAYLAAAGIAGEAKDSPLFRASNGRTGKLTGKPLRTERICELVKRRLKDAGLPLWLSPHSFRVTGITDLLSQNVPLEAVQQLAGHADPRTTRLYDRREQKVSRNLVERISI
jgi:site-specific recombinase XerD